MPEPLPALIGKKEVRHSLRTRNKKEAHRLQHLEDVKLDREWGLLLSGDGTVSVSPEDDIRRANEWAAEQVREDAIRRLLGSPERRFGEDAAVQDNAHIYDDWVTHPTESESSDHSLDWHLGVAE